MTPLVIGAGILGSAVLLLRWCAILNLVIYRPKKRDRE
jgi:hypothetical protein